MDAKRREIEKSLSPQQEGKGHSKSNKWSWYAANKAEKNDFDTAISSAQVDEAIGRYPASNEPLDKDATSSLE